MRSRGRRPRPWWSSWSLQVTQLVPTVFRGLLGIAAFLVCAVLFIALAGTPTRWRVVMAALIVAAVVGLVTAAAAHTHRRQKT